MRVKIADLNKEAEKLLPPTKSDGSGIGINYADAFVKVIKHTLADGRKIGCRRRGAKITLTMGDKKGEGLMRRLAHGPDPRKILHEALLEAARNLGAGYVVVDNAIYLEIPE
jgi:hypothetical protein